MPSFRRSVQTTNKFKSPDINSCIIKIIIQVEEGPNTQTPGGMLDALNTDSLARGGRRARFKYTRRAAGLIGNR